MEGLNSGAVTAPFKAAEDADCIIVIGARPAENHPVAATYLKNAAKRGAELIVIDPRGQSQGIARNASHVLQFKPGSDVALLNAMLHTIVTENLYDKQYVQANTEGFDDLKDKVIEFSPEKMADVCGIAAETIKQVARIYALSKASIIFWGMGSSFTSGSKNVVVKIDKEKYSTQDFANFIRLFGPVDQKIDSEEIDELLSIFIGNKLIEKEYERLEIKLSDNSLSKLIKNQKEFKRKNTFSRTEYEKFLLTNNLNAANFETNLSRQEKKKQLFNFIGGGILPSKFTVNTTYNKINQRRNIELINLNDIFIKEFNFSENQIKSYYKDNKDNYKEIYKSVRILEINPKILIGSDDFNDLFFKKIDDIHDELIQGENLDFIIKKYNLEKGNIFSINESGEDKNSKIISHIPKNLIKDIFSLSDADPTTLIEKKDKFFIIEILKTENIQSELGSANVRENIVRNLETGIKRKLISEIISKLNQNSFIKSDFIKLSEDKDVVIKKIALDSKNDISTLKKELVNQIYAIPEKKINLVNDIGLTENYLIYIDMIENVSIDEKSDEYEKYLDLSKTKITNRLFNTYDNFIKEKYKIDINYKALNTVKNYFN